MALARRIKPLVLILFGVCIMCYILISFDEKLIVDEEVADKNIDTFGQLSILEIREIIEQLNKQQIIQYERIFEPLSENCPVIVIQTHNRPSNLKRVIDGLSRANGIEKALLIFSHDFYDENIISLVKRIDFCKTLQIFYPYSIQTHPNSFPGDSPEDCPRDISSNMAIAINCSNALHPDRYGHYREAKLTQTKHHWWWTMNHIFDRLNVTRNFNSWVVFLEEDDYVAAPDFVHMIRLMRDAQQLKCPECGILCLGSRGSIADGDYGFYGNHAEITPWQDNNIGMAFRRSSWKEIKACAPTFCTHDDYKYDRSFFGVIQKCLQHEVLSINLRAPRVFRLGDCEAPCNDLLDIQTKVNDSMVYFFPEELLLTRVDNSNLRKSTMNGGWGDIRDHELCMEMTKSEN